MRQLHQIPITQIMVGTAVVTPIHTIRNLGIHIDSGLTMQAHVAITISNCQDVHFVNGTS